MILVLMRPDGAVTHSQKKTLRNMEILKKKRYSFLFVFLIFTGCTAQEPPIRAHCRDADFDEKVASCIKFSVPTVSPGDLKKMNTAIILDAREPAEYAVSHLPNAQNCGYKNFSEKNWLKLPHDVPIVVYCSIGYRSEKIGEQLQKAGFTKVYNLYGSIFEWINCGYEVVDDKNNLVKKVHTYNKAWSKWVKVPVEKVY